MALVNLRLAVPADAPAIVALRDEAARWQQAHGITQWTPGQVSQAEVESAIADGHWWLSHDDAGLAGTIRLVWSDLDYWGPQPPVAGYVHGLVTRREPRAQAGLGAAMVEWAADRVRAAGRPLLRLDCIASNNRLRAYYCGLGFREVAVRTIAIRPYPVQLFEKPVSSSATDPA